MIQSKFILIDGVRTHYLEAGAGPVLVLLHSGEFGASAELTWEHNLPALARHFHVYAPDWLGFGQTAKVFSFDDMWSARVGHMSGFLRALCIDRAHFMGNSMGGTILAEVAATPELSWPIDRMILVSGAGETPDNDARRILNSYDGTREHMRQIISILCRSPAIRNDETYLDRRHQASLAPGAWECTAAARFKAPWRGAQGRAAPDYGRILAPTLIVAGGRDPLRKPTYGTDLQNQIPGARLAVFSDAGHCSQIDAADAFNETTIDFLKG